MPFTKNKTKQKKPKNWSTNLSGTGTHHILFCFCCAKKSFVSRKLNSLTSWLHSHQDWLFVSFFGFVSLLLIFYIFCTLTVHIYSNKMAPFSRSRKRNVLLKCTCESRCCGSQINYLAPNSWNCGNWLNVLLQVQLHWNKQALHWHHQG